MYRLIAISILGRLQICRQRLTRIYSIQSAFRALCTLIPCWAGLLGERLGQPPF
jgi:hypothetical protein